MDLFKKQRLLIIAPHPDDEVIGAGGLIAKAKDELSRVFVLFLTVGDTQDFTKTGISTAKQRLAEISKVAKFLKYDDFEIAFGGNQYHLKLDTLAQLALISAIERDSRLSVNKVKPTIILFPSFTSYNQDHRVAANAGFTASRPGLTQFKHLPEIVLSYEEPSDFWSQEKKFEPNIFVELTASQFEKKIRALKFYKSQLRGNNHPRSPEVLISLAKLRGSQIGATFAEGFVAHRIKN